MRPLKAGLVYFLLVFALGWVLGPIRELWAVPRFGRITALLIEAIIMLIAMVISSRWVMRRFNVPQSLGSTIPMGLVALAILAPAEIAGVLWVRGLSLREYLASFVTLPGVISLVMFLVFAAIIFVVIVLVGGFGIWANVYSNTPMHTKVLFGLYFLLMLVFYAWVNQILLWRNATTIGRWLQRTIGPWLQRHALPIGVVIFFGSRIFAAIVSA